MDTPSSGFRPFLTALRIANMLIFERITTDYNETEDRLQLSGEASSGDHTVIWVTQRLLQRLVPVLLQWLERKNDGSGYSEVLHAFAQTAAREELVAQPPVRPGDSNDVWLVRSIDITQAEHAVTLTFIGAPAQKALLTLEEKFLRQWLSIVYETSLRAEWPTTIWPEWVRESSAAPIKAGKTLFH